MWTGRILLEADQYRDNCFCSLTYDDEHLHRMPNGMPTLEPVDPKNFLKRLRKSIEPGRIRFYLVGEYGPKTQRPHYHAILFNLPTCLRGRTLRNDRDQVIWRSCCASCRLVGRAWGLGDVDLGTVDIGSAKYVGGYVLKKMTRNDDPRLHGRHQEFARMSLRPGIGHSALHELASELMRLDLDSPEADVPVSLRRGKTFYPVGRYLRQQLRKMIGRSPDALTSGITEEMLSLYLAARADKENPSYKKALVDAGSQSALNQKTRDEIFKQKRGL